MYYHHDPDEWEMVSEFHDYGPDPSGNRMGSASWSLRRRAPEDVVRIKAERRAAHEAGVLAEADAIRARRATAAPKP